MLRKLLCRFGFHKWEQTRDPLLSQCAGCQEQTHFHSWKYEKGGYVGGPFCHIVGARSCRCGLKEFCHEVDGGYGNGYYTEWRQASESEWSKAIKV